MKVMIDLETMGTNVTWQVALVSIGMVIFDDSFKTVEEREWYIDQNHLPKWAVKDKCTVEWWKKQDNYEELMSQVKERGVMPVVALKELDLIFNKYEIDEVWMRGPHFDATILDSYCLHYLGGKVIPFYKVRDLRTLIKTFENRVDAMNLSGTPHLALEDCHQQIAILRHYYKQLDLI